MGDSYAIDGCIARGARMGQNGLGASHDVSPTISTLDIPAVMCRAGLQANSEMYDNLCPCMSRRQHKDPPIVVMKGER